MAIHLEESTTCDQKGGRNAIRSDVLHVQSALPVADPLVIAARVSLAARVALSGRNRVGRALLLKTYGYKAVVSNNEPVLLAAGPVKS